MMFKSANEEFIKITGFGIEHVKNVRVFDCYDVEDFDKNFVEKGKMWLVTDEYGQVLKIVDLT